MKRMTGTIEELGPDLSLTLTVTFERLSTWQSGTHGNLGWWDIKDEAFEYTLSNLDGVNPEPREYQEAELKERFFSADWNAILNRAIENAEPETEEL